MYNLPLSARRFPPRHSTFLPPHATLFHMDKQEHGLRLKAAMSRKGLGREAVADIAKVTVRTVTNWTRGDNLPEHEWQREALRELLGPYDIEGDPVEAAVRGSRLTEDRQYGVIGYYKRQLREQDAEDERGATA